MRCTRRAKTRNGDSYDWKINDHDTDSPMPSRSLSVRVHSLEDSKIKESEAVPTAMSPRQAEDVSAIHYCKDQVAETMVSCCSTFSPACPIPRCFVATACATSESYPSTVMTTYYTIYKGPTGSVLFTEDKIQSFWVLSIGDTAAGGPMHASFRV